MPPYIAEKIKDNLAAYKIPCDCLKGGEDGEGRVCQKCGGSQYVFPDDIRSALQEAYQKGLEEGEEKGIAEGIDTARQALKAFNKAQEK